MGALRFGSLSGPVAPADEVRRPEFVLLHPPMLEALGRTQAPYSTKVCRVFRTTSNLSIRADTRSVAATARRSLHERRRWSPGGG